MNASLKEPGLPARTLGMKVVGSGLVCLMTLSALSCGGAPARLKTTGSHPVYNGSDWASLYIVHDKAKSSFTGGTSSSLKMAIDGKKELIRGYDLNRHGERHVKGDFSKSLNNLQCIFLEPGQRDLKLQFVYNGPRGMARSRVSSTSMMFPPRGVSVIYFRSIGKDSYLYYNKLGIFHEKWLEEIQGREFEDPDWGVWGKKEKMTSVIHLIARVEHATRLRDAGRRQKNKKK